MRRCSECNTPLGSRAITSKTCSDGCRSKRSRRLRKISPTEYPCGHARTAENTYVRGNGVAVCRTCKRAAKAKWQASCRKKPENTACVQCGVVLEGRSWGTRYCSKRCSTAARRARRPVTTFSCQVCSKDVARRQGKQVLCDSPECKSIYARIKKYGITHEAYQEMRHTQNNACAICDRTAPLCVDHCHGSGAVRGLLCRDCNLGLGHMKDDISALRRAIAYLEGVTSASVSQGGR